MADERELTWRVNTDTGAATADIQKIDKELDKVKANMMSIDKNSGVFGRVGGAVASAGGHIKNFGASVSGVGANIKSIGGNISSVSSNISSVGARMTAVAAGITLAFKRGVDSAVELDTAIRKVSTLADREVLPVDQVSKDVRRISDLAGIAQTEISESMYEALSSGVKSEDVVGFVEQGVKLTKAGFTDMPTVIDATTTALNAYGLSGAAATSHIQDVMVKTQDLGKITVDELGKNIGRVIPFASAAGVSIDQLGAGYALLTSKGQNAHIATTNLSSMISELSATGSKSDKALRATLGKSFKELMTEGSSLGDVLSSLQGVAKSEGLELGDMFGNSSATAAANALAEEGPGQFNDALSAMVNSAGAVDANFEAMQGPAEQYQQTMTKLKNSFIELGATMMPVFEKVGEMINTVIEKFNGLDEGTKQTVATVLAIATVAGPVLMILGTIGTAIGGIISGVGAMIGVVGSIISGIGGAFGALGGFLAGIPAMAASVGSAIIGFITSPFGIALGVIAAVIAIGYLLYNNWDMIKTKAGEIANAIRGFLAPAVDFVKGAFASFANTLSTVVSGAISTVMGMFNSLSATAKAAINGIIGARNALKSALAAPINAVVNIGKGIVSGVKNVAGGVGRALGFSTGLDYVPYDEFPAMLHKGEMVVTAKGSEQLRSMGANRDGFSTPPSNNYFSDMTAPTNNYDNNNSQSTFSPVINVTVNGDGGGNVANDIADIVEEKLMQLFMTAELQRG